MNSYPVIFPIIIIFMGALAAVLCGVPALNRRLTAPRLGWILSVVPGPATSHAVGSAAKRINLPMKGARRDDLAGETKTALK